MTLHAVAGTNASNNGKRVYRQSTLSFSHQTNIDLTTEDASAKRKYVHSVAEKAKEEKKRDSVAAAVQTVTEEDAMQEPPQSLPGRLLYQLG
jgi:hypothetical protein